MSDPTPAKSKIHVFIHAVMDWWHSVVTHLPDDGALKRVGRHTARASWAVTSGGVTVYSLLVLLDRIWGESPSLRAAVEGVIKPLLPYIVIVAGLLGPVEHDHPIPTPPDDPPGPVAPVEPAPPTDLESTGADANPEAPPASDDCASGRPIPCIVTVAAGWNGHDCPSTDTDSCDVLWTTDQDTVGWVYERLVDPDTKRVWFMVNLIATPPNARLNLGNPLGWVVSDAVDNPPDG